MAKKIIFFAFGVVSGVLNGLLGTGGGTVVVPVLEYFGKLPVQKAHATAISIILPISAVSSYFYLKQGDIRLKAVLIISVAGIVGGLVGARFLKKLSPKITKRIFSVSMIILGVRMLWK